jgi:hypothetical protein
LAQNGLELSSIKPSFVVSLVFCLQELFQSEKIGLDPSKSCLENSVLLAIQFGGIM